MKAAPHLANAIRYLHLEAQIAESEDEFENFSIALKLLGLLCDGWNGGPGLFNLAVCYSMGVCHAKYLYRRAQRAEFRRLELLASIPDYDYSREPRIPDRDPADGRRHFGNKHGVTARGQAIKEAAARLGIAERTIRRRLYEGWTWEQAVSEPQRQGRKLYGNQFCNLGSEASAADDTSATRQSDENDSPAGQRSGMWTSAQNRHSIPSRAGAQGEPGMSDPNRRKPPGRVSSVAQIRTLKRAADQVTYFGA